MRTSRILAEALWLGALGLFAACTPETTSAPAGDAAPDAAAADADRPDAGAADTGARDSAPGEGGPPDAASPGPRTVRSVPGLADFDITATRMVLRVGSELSVCTLPACADRRAIPNTGGHKGTFSIAGDRVYFTAFAPSSIQDNVFSIALDGSDRVNRTNHAVPGGLTVSSLNAESFSAGVTRVEQGVRWVRSDDAGYRFLFETTSGTSGNADRVGRPTAHLHENFGAEVRYLPAQMPFVSQENNPTRAITAAVMTATGATLPAPERPPGVVAVSARGPSVARPMAFYLDGGRLLACPTTADCAAWIDLGELGGVLNVDGERLYVGDAHGLGSCLVSEIATQRRCTLKTMVSGEPVQAPLYVTAGELWYRSGELIRAVDKGAGVTCSPGSRLPRGATACVPCAVGQRPSANAAACLACPRGTYADAAGAATCTACPENTSTAGEESTSAGCLPCPVGYVSNAATNHLCQDAERLKIFVTPERHNGDFAGDAALAGANAIERADSFCMASAARPAGTYKALLVDGANRTAVPAVDWVLRPNKGYYQSDGATPIGTTDASSVFPFPLTHAWSGDLAQASWYPWSGVTSSWALGDACGGWTVGVPGTLGRAFVAGRVDAIGLAASCQITQPLLCVEQ